MSTPPKHRSIPRCFHDHRCNDALHEGATVPVPAGERFLMPICRTNNPYDWGDLSPQELIELVYLRSFDPEFQPPPENLEPQRGEHVLPVAVGDLGCVEPHEAIAQAGVMERRPAAYRAMLRDTARIRMVNAINDLVQGARGGEDVRSGRGKDIEVVRKSVFGEGGGW